MTRSTIVECHDLMRRPFRLMYVTGRLWLRERDSAPFRDLNGLRMHFSLLDSEAEELAASREDGYSITLHSTLVHAR